MKAHMWLTWKLQAAKTIRIYISHEKDDKFRQRLKYHYRGWINPVMLIAKANTSYLQTGVQ